MNTELTTIPQKRKVFYDTYANLPTTGLNIGDLGYATDRLVFYRWSGAAWQAITIHSSSGAAAAIPTAADLPNGSLYYETDTGITKQVQAGAWASISSPGSLLTVAETEVFSGTSPITYTDLDLSGVVGSNIALVLLKFSFSGISRSVVVRKNGDTDDFYEANAEAKGCVFAFCGLDSVHYVLWVPTDASGIIEWQASVNDAATTVDVMAYIK